MSVLSQPTNYSEVLRRIFASTLVFGAYCTFLLAYSRLGEGQTIIDALIALHPLALLGVAAPFVIAIVSQAIKLHNRISDLFKIRLRFDTQCLLRPLAEGTGYIVDRAKAELLAT